MSSFSDQLAAEFLTGVPQGGSEQAQTTVTLNGNSIVTYVTGGKRYAAIGAATVDAQNLLTNNPAECVCEP